MMPSLLVRTYRSLRDWVQDREAHERSLELTGSLLSREVRALRNLRSIQDAEFRVYSQFGDDGIIQWLTGLFPALPKRFVEFGVEDYTEANTRFLMVNDGWSGLVMDGLRDNIQRLRSRRWFWRHDLEARDCFLTRENVDAEIAAWARDQPVGLLHIDVDGNDFWLWDAIACIEPGIVIMEYNAVFGSERCITIPYASDFRRLQAHPSGQYAGASLGALAQLGHAKGYALIGTNRAGNNAYFLRRDLLCSDVRELSVPEAFTLPAFRESRNNNGKLDFATYGQRVASIKGMPVWNVTRQCTEAF